MPPSKKKKSLRGPYFSPAAHLQSNPHSDAKSMIEQLFLLRRFDDALELSFGILSELCNRDEDDKHIKNKQPITVTDDSADPHDKIMHLTHSCKVNIYCCLLCVVIYC